MASNARRSLPSSLTSSHRVTPSLPASSTTIASPSTTGNPITQYNILRRLLTRIHYTAPFSPSVFVTSAPPTVTLPIISHLFLAFSPALTSYFLQRGFLLSSSAFSLSSLYSLLLCCFHYQPALSQRQFSSERGYVERKLMMIVDIIHLCLNKHEELTRARGRKDEGDGRTGDIPRVARLVKTAGGDTEDAKARTRKESKGRKDTNTADKQRERRREDNEQHDHDMRRDEWTGRIVVQAEREEEKDASDDNSEPMTRAHQHISFTQDDDNNDNNHAPFSSSFSSPPSSHHHHDTLASLHHQLHSIAHRTEQLQQRAHTDTPPAAASVDELRRRMDGLESVMAEELRRMQEMMSRVESRLAVLEAREEEGSGRGGGKEEEEKRMDGNELESKEEEKATVDDRVLVDVERGKDRDMRKSGAVPNDTSAFLDHMQARLAATANLIDNARRLRRGEDAAFDKRNSN